MAARTSRDERRAQRRAARERRRGGPNRAPVGVQRLARRVGDTAWYARETGARAVAGDRPLVVGFVVLLVLGAVMLSGPLQRYMDGRERVDVLQAKLEALQQENGSLEQRRQDLEDPEKVELLAREQQGMIYPGEVPYAVIPPEVERPRIARGSEGTEAPGGPWYSRAWDALTDVFR